MDFERQQYVDLDLKPERMTLQRFIPGEYHFTSWPSENNIESALRREVYELRRAFERTSPILTI